MFDSAARADGISGIVVVGVIYAILTIVAKIKEASKASTARPAEPPAQGQQRPTLPDPPVRQDARSRSDVREPRSAVPMRVGPARTPLEGTKLEELLRVLGQTTGVPAQGPMGRPSRAPLPSAEEVEDRESLEVGANVQDLETEVRRSERKVVDEDDEAEAVAERRIRIAEVRDYTPLGRADHLEFDKRIRPVAADKTAVAPPGRSRLQSAMVWREILGPPIGLRDRDLP